MFGERGGLVGNQGRHQTHTECSGDVPGELECWQAHLRFRSRERWIEDRLGAAGGRWRDSDNVLADPACRVRVESNVRVVGVISIGRGAPVQPPSFVQYDVSEPGFRVLDFLQPGEEPAVHLQRCGNRTVGAHRPGIDGDASNSQCTVSGTGSSVVKSKYTLTLNVPVTFTGTFAAGLNSIFASGVVDGRRTDWKQLGTWGTTVTAHRVAEPDRRVRSESYVHFAGVDPAGVGDLTNIHLLFNTTSANQVSACSLFFNSVTNQLFLYDDTGAKLSAPIYIYRFDTGTLSNSQCTVTAAGSSSPRPQTILR